MGLQSCLFSLLTELASALTTFAAKRDLEGCGFSLSDVLAIGQRSYNCEVTFDRGSPAVGAIAAREDSFLATDYNPITVTPRRICIQESNFLFYDRCGNSHIKFWRRCFRLDWRFLDRFQIRWRCLGERLNS